MSAPDPGAPLVAVTGLGKRYGKQFAVRDVSFDAFKGELIGLVGANGGGKTTTLRMIGGLLRPDAGSGTVLGADIADRRRARIARIGHMTQQLSLYPDLSVHENLMFRARVHRLPKPSLSVGQAVERFGLGAVVAQRVGTLSGGWARRAQFVATVLPAPDLLLLDEPTAGLDAAARRDIWGWIATMVAGGCTAIVSTHDMADAGRCDRVVPYHAGRAHPPLVPADFIAGQGADTFEAAILTLAGSGT